MYCSSGRISTSPGIPSSMAISPVLIYQQVLYGHLQWDCLTRESVIVMRYIWSYSWNFFPKSARSHWLLWVHLTSSNKTVSRQNLWAGNVAKSMTSEGNSALLPAIVNRRPPSQRGLINFQLYNKTLQDWSLGKQLILFPSNLNVSLSRFSGNKINCFSWEQSWSV